MNQRNSQVGANARLRLLEVTNVVPWEADAETWRFTYVGSQAKALLGYPVEQWYEEDFWPSHLHPDDRDFALNFCLTSSQRLTDYEFEYRMIAADGRSVWLNDVVNVVSKDGRPQVLRGFLKDISERKHLEEKLRKSQQQLDELVKHRTLELQGLLGRYRALIDALPDVMLRLDDDCVYRDFFAGDQVKLAYPPEHFLGKRPSDVLEPELGEAAETRVREVLDSGRMQVWEYEQNIDGNLRQYEARIVPCCGNEVIAIIRDFTHNKRMHERLRLSESRLREAQRIAKIGNWEWDTVKEELWWSDETYRIYGVDKETPLTYNSFIGSVHPADRERVSREVADAQREGSSYNHRFRLLLPDGTIKTLDSRAQPVEDEHGRVTRWIGVVQDVTELMGLNTRLREQNEELAVRDRNKDLFLTTLGHELRNPLGAIKNSLDLISLLPAGADGEHERQLALDVIQRQSDQTLSLLDDLLDLERIKHGKFELRLENLDLGLLASEVLASFRSRASVSGVELKLAQPAEPAFVQADRARLQQIFQNLLDNALRFTESGEVAITLFKGTETAAVTVRDTGSGIDPKDANLVFETYYQGSRGKNPASGLGFGLALVKGVVEKHGGTIELRSDGPGTGTTIEFTLPLAESSVEDQQHSRRIAEPRCRRVLVVDDERDNATMFGALLKTLGQDTRVAYDGESALEIAHEHRPEIAFLDLSMPGMDGREVARRLRETFSPAELVLVAVTGLPRSVNGAGGQDPDFAHYLLKPARLEEVVNLLNDI